MDLQEFEWRGTGWIALAWVKTCGEALLNAVMNLRVP